VLYCALVWCSLQLGHEDSGPRARCVLLRLRHDATRRRYHCAEDRRQAIDVDWHVVDGGVDATNSRPHHCWRFWSNICCPPPRRNWPSKLRWCRRWLPTTDACCRQLSCCRAQICRFSNTIYTNCYETEVSFGGSETLFSTLRLRFSSWEMNCNSTQLKNLFDQKSQEWRLREVSRHNFGIMWSWSLSWPQKLLISSPCPVDHLYQFATKSVLSFSKCGVYNRTNAGTNEWTNERTGREHNACGCQSGLVET